MSRRSVQIIDPSGEVSARVDTTSRHLIQMNEIHARIHEGSFFSTGLADPALANDGVLEIVIQTPATGAIHARFAGAAGGDFRVGLFEGTTFSAAGTTLTPSNRNRLSSIVTTATFTHTPTLTLDGTALFDGYIGGGTGGNAIGGQISSFEEFILDQSTNYLARVTNVSGQASLASLTVQFYDTNFSTPPHLQPGGPAPP